MDVPVLLADADRALVLPYVPLRERRAIATVFALDERLGTIVARAREPAIGLMRLVWWRDRLEGLVSGVPAEPLLVDCAAASLDGPALAAMTAGWEALLDDPAVGDETVTAHASERGGRLFAIVGGLLGADDRDGARLRRAGEGWATVDLARRAGGRTRSIAIREQGRQTLTRAMAERWPRPLRPLGGLAALALLDAEGVGSARRHALRLLRHQLTGR